MTQLSGTKLRAARIAADLRPEHVAVLVGRSTYSIHDYERGRVSPPISVLLALAEIYRVPLDALLDEEAVDAVTAS